MISQSIINITTNQKIYNMTLPEWFTPDVASKLFNLTRDANMYLYGIGKPYSPELIKLRGGTVLFNLPYLTFPFRKHAQINQ